MTIIENKTFDEERALYGLCDATARNLTFEGPADGESAFKEARNIIIENCKFALRYPIWHTHGFELCDSTMTETCRASLWYCSNGIIKNTTCTGVKALRECDKVKIVDSDFASQEFGWRCRDIEAVGSKFVSEYIFFGSQRLTLD